MAEQFYFTRASLKAPIANALRGMFMVKNADAVNCAKVRDEEDRAFTHKLIWQLFGGDPASRRQFLYHITTARPEVEGVIISAEKPLDPMGTWELDTQLVQESLFQAGQLIPFSMDVVATSTIAGKRYSLLEAVKRRIRDGLPLMGRLGAEIEQGTLTGEDIQRAAPGDILPFLLAEWFNGKTDKTGFQVFEETIVVNETTVHVLPDVHNPRSSIPAVSTSLNGRLEVTQPDLFCRALLTGMGRNRAFGFGMLRLR